MKTRFGLIAALLVGMSANADVLRPPQSQGILITGGTPASQKIVWDSANSRFDFNNGGMTVGTDISLNQKAIFSNNYAFQLTGTLPYYQLTPTGNTTWGTGSVLIQTGVDSIYSGEGLYFGISVPTGRKFQISEGNTQLAEFNGSLIELKKPVSVSQNLSGTASIFTIENTNSTTGSVAELDIATVGGTWKFYGNREGTIFKMDDPYSVGILTYENGVGFTLSKAIVGTSGTWSGQHKFGSGSGGLTGTNYKVGVYGSSTAVAQTAIIQLGDNANGSSRQWAISNGQNATTQDSGVLHFIASSAVNTDAMSGTGASVMSLSPTAITLSKSVTAQDSVAIKNLSGGVLSLWPDNTGASNKIHLANGGSGELRIWNHGSTTILGSVTQAGEWTLGPSSYSSTRVNTINNNTLDISSRGYSASADAQVALELFSKGNARNLILAEVQTDSGTNPGLTIDVRQSASAVSIRPLFRIDNYGVSRFEISAAGAVTAPYGIHSFKGQTASLGSGGFQTILSAQNRAVYIIHASGDGNSTEYINSILYVNGAGGCNFNTLGSVTLSLSCPSSGIVRLTNGSTTQTLSYSILRLQ